MRAQNHISQTAATNTLGDELLGLRHSIPRTQRSLNNSVVNPSVVNVTGSEFDVANLRISSDNGHRRLLSILGIPPLDGLKTKDAEDMLDTKACDGQRKTRDASSSVENSVNQVLCSYLDNSSCTHQIVVDALLADTAYHTVQMFDSDLKSGLTSLETAITKIGGDMGELDLEKLKLPSKERDRFVTQWGHE